MSQIKAWTYKGAGYPNNLTLSDVPAPTSPPSPTSLVIQLHAAALNPVDIQLMNFPIWHLPWLAFPKKPGCDFAGTVLSAGSAVSSQYQKGDAVFGLAMDPFGNGTLAEVITVDTAKACLLKKPEKWSWAQAAALPLVWLTSRTCVACVEPYVKNSKVVVLGGSSATGMYSVWLAKKRGWEVLSTCSAKNADFVRGMGATHIVDYTKENVREKVQEFQPDAIIDCVGGTEALGIAKRYVTIVGDKTGREAMGGSMIYLWHPKMVLRWALGRLGWGEVYDCIMLDGKKEYLEEALELPDDKVIIDSTYLFEDTKRGYERLNEGHTKGKVVVEVKD